MNESEEKIIKTKEKFKKIHFKDNLRQIPYCSSAIDGEIVVNLGSLKPWGENSVEQEPDLLSILESIKKDEKNKKYYKFELGASCFTDLYDFAKVDYYVVSGIRVESDSDYEKRIKEIIANEEKVAKEKEDRVKIRRSKEIERAKRLLKTEGLL